MSSNSSDVMNLNSQTNLTKTNPTLTTQNYGFTGMRRSSLEVNRKKSEKTSCRFALQEALHFCKSYLTMYRAKHGMITTYTGVTTLNPVLTLKTSHIDLQVLRLEIFRSSDLLKICERIYSKSNRKYRIYSDISYDVLIKIPRYAIEYSKRILILCADIETTRACCAFLRKNDVKSCIFTGTTSVAPKMYYEESVCLMSIADFLLASSQRRKELQVDLYFVHDAHMRTAPYQALLYMVNAMSFNTTWVFYSLGNDTLLSDRPPLNERETQLSSMDPKQWVADSQDYVTLKSLRSSRVLFMYSSMDECQMARKKLFEMGFKTVLVINDSISHADIETQCTVYQSMPFVLLTTGWPERFLGFSFDCVYDCGYVEHLQWNDGFVLRKSPIYYSEYKYRRCLSKNYFLFLPEAELGVSPDHSNSLINIDIKAFLQINGLQPDTPHSSDIESILIGKSCHAISAYFATTLPAPIFFSYVNDEGYVEDNFSQGMSLFLSRQTYLLQSSGQEKMIQSYDRWVDVVNVDTLIKDFKGYTKVPCISYVDEIVCAMLIINTYKAPSIYDRMISFDSENSSQENIYALKSFRAGMKPSLSTPPRLQSYKAQLSSPLSPSMITERVRASSLPSLDVSSSESLDNDKEATTLNNDSELQTIRECEEEHSDSDIISMYSIDSKMSFKKKKKNLKRSNTIKQKVSKVKDDFARRASIPEVETRRLEFVVNKHFGKPGFSPQRYVRNNHDDPFQLTNNDSSSMLLSEVSFRYLIAPSNVSYESFSIQDKVRGSDILMMYKYIIQMEKLNKSLMSPRTEIVLLIAFCRCWNSLACGKQLTENHLSLFQRTRLALLTNTPKVRDVIRIDKMQYVARKPPFSGFIVRVVASNNF